MSVAVGQVSAVARLGRPPPLGIVSDRVALLQSSWIAGTACLGDNHPVIPVHKGPTGEGKSPDRWFKRSLIMYDFAS